jgi:FtsP/CotA-like multicopper oxidase with cupredoxin domain
MWILKYREPKLVRIARRNRQEIVRAGLTRRELFRLGLLTSAGLLVPIRGLSARASCTEGCRLGCSPPTTPFVEPLPIMPILREVPESSLVPAPTTNPNTAINPNTGLPFEGRVEPHQFRDRFPPVKFFETRMVRAELRIARDGELPLQPLWAFTDPVAGPSVPGPTIVSRYGQPILVRRHNELPPQSGNDGFGKPSVSTHLHNFHSAPESDGGPCRFFERGQYFDYHHTMANAGFNTPEFSATDGDIRESLSTLWYHDHRIDFTAPNVYKGLGGFHLVFNEFDTGDENTGFRLPSFPEFDIPLFLADKLIDPETGLICFDLFNFDGLVGDKFTVNGMIQPFLEVRKRRYRFRILDGGPSRFYQLFLTDLDRPNQQIPFWIISNDGNLLPKPIQATSVRIGVAERFDIIVDFSQIPNNPSRIYLENRLRQDDGRGPSNEILPAGQGNLLLEFRIGEPAPDNSVDPATLPTFYEVPVINPADSRITRTFEFERKNGQWAINDKFATCEDIRFRVRRNSVERWILRNSSGGWAHPIHIHLEEFQLQKINRVAVRPGQLEFARKDVVRLEANTEVELLMRFRDFLGDYPMHCHNTIHEDHAMLLLFAIDEVGDNKTKP